MGFSPQVQSNQTNQSGKGSSAPNSYPINPNPPDGGSGQMPDSSNGLPSGKGGNKFTYSPTSGQPAMGAPNQYSNTVGQWDNTQQQTQQPNRFMGKGA